MFFFIAYVDFLCPELRQKVADESAAKEAVHTALTAAQMEFAELEQTAVSMCQELEGEGAGERSYGHLLVEELGLLLLERCPEAL